MRIAFSTREQQKRSLPDIINRNKENTDFMRLLCVHLSQMPPETIDTNIKQSLIQLLLINKQNLTVEKNQFKNMRYKIEMPVCNWLDSYATVATTDQQENNKFMANYVKRQLTF